MVENPKFDVFLAHNSVDKPQVRAIASELRRRGLNPWLDEEQIPPGELFQEAIQRAIPQIKSAAICIGLVGLGRWQVIELQTLISQFVERGIRVIPVLLPGVDRIPDNLLFLRQFNWVSFEKIDDAASLYKLEWGITRIKPQPQPIVTELPEHPTIESETGVSPSSSKSTSNKIYRFEIITVDAKGQEVKREPGQAEYFPEDLGNGVFLDMVAIPGGKFLMGTEDEEIERLCKKYDTDWFKAEQPQHEVTVKPFFMGKYPVTQAQWRAIASLPKVERDLDPDPARFKDRENSDRAPVESVSWEDAVEFCQRLSQKTGKVYRLPTEAEWEYACRAKTTTPFHFGETISTDLANYRGTDWEYKGKVYPGNYGRGLKGIFRKQTTPVGYFKVANNFGLYDMHGNVWEWCEDDWHENYRGVPTNGSAWLTEGSSNKVVRGGSWIVIPDFCRSAYRLNLTRDVRSYVLGFRVVCVALRTT